MVDRLQDRVALVTGAASGIGRATAERFAEEGAAVLVTDIQDAAGEEVADGLRDSGVRAGFLHHDVASEESWQEAIDHVVAEFGGLDILVNNAGIGDVAPLEETTKEQYERTIAVTQTSVFLGMKAAAEQLKASRYGSVVNVSSIYGVGGGFGTSPGYHAAKGAVRLLTKNTAMRWVGDGVRVNSVHPGFVDTPILDNVKGTEIEAGMVAVMPMGRLARPSEIAAAIAFLASDDASFMTGSELHVDGGYLAR
ncbi:SDR family oxidoreductase [Saccharopolyspora karakumensis]|uniref:SDR family oxidoreductase n=1 Tax=Saccharopolyspora karakumensis TaxID=2530386 RepID=A0A4R5BYX2_9PSEU|nr:glucose 1-dehydrogenase [Saccharopolyspora karakumensis]TDD90650.1 SDR family oxidoreductase [Saccharopolyspora karakumensis]